VLFVDGLGSSTAARLWRGRISVGELHALLTRFLGPARADEALAGYRPGGKFGRAPSTIADSELVEHVETVLAGSIGSASARIVVASLVGEEQLRVNEVMEMIDDVSHVAALEERHRLARELHDSVSQALFSMTLQTRAVELAVQKEGGDANGKVARGLSELRHLTQGALAEMRALIFQLRPDALHEEGLAAAVTKHAAAVAARDGLDIEVHAPEERLALDDRAEEELFRVVQEAVHNSVKHAQPTRIDIRFDDGDELVIEVADDGVGFDPDALHPGHLGLESMRERTERLGGTLTVRSSPTSSTSVRAVLPPGSLHRTSAGHAHEPYEM
jgi:signal transduction histidine kinase